MINQKRNYDAAFKAKIALELVKGQKTVNEIATEHGLHPNMITKWKKQLLDELPGIFSNGNSVGKKEKEYENLIASLYQKIGQLEVELDWLKKKSGIFRKR
jgi:putative transposase